MAFPAPASAAPPCLSKPPSSFSPPSGSHWGREPERWEEPGATVGGGLAPAAFALARLLPPPGRGRRTNRAELGAPRRKMREAAQGRRKSAGPLSGPGAWFSSPVGPLALERVIVSRTGSESRSSAGLPAQVTFHSSPREHAGGASLHPSKPTPPPDSDYPLGLSLRPPAVRFPGAPWLGPGRWRFRASDPAAERGQGGGEDTLSSHRCSC